MRTLFSNRYADAGAKTLLIFGIVHLAILVLLVGRSSLYILNAFTILNLDLVMPDLGDGPVSFVASYGVVLIVYGLVFRWLTKPAQSSDE